MKHVKSSNSSFLEQRFEEMELSMILTKGIIIVLVELCGAEASSAQPCVEMSP